MLRQLLKVVSPKQQRLQTLQVPEQPCRQFSNVRQRELQHAELREDVQVSFADGQVGLVDGEHFQFRELGECFAGETRWD